MMKKIVTFAMLITSVFLASTSYSKTLITYADANTSPAVYLDTGAKGDSMGDQWLFDQPLLNEHGENIGINSGFCIRTKVGHSSQCQWTLTLAKGTVSVAGREFDDGESAVSIIGGTGNYSGISGELITAKQANGTFKQTLLFSKKSVVENKNTRSVLSLINGVKENGHYACSECHSETGNPIITDKYNKQSPILAGQDRHYLKKQLTHFKSGERFTKEMENVLLDYSQDEIIEMANYFSDQDLVPSESLDPTVDTLIHTQAEDLTWVNKGKMLYENGNDVANVLACIDCHGNKGEGNISKQAPKLTSQHARYVRMTLTAYKDGSRTTDKHLPGDSANIMAKISQQLSANDIKHLAAYIQSLK